MTNTFTGDQGFIKEQVTVKNVPQYDKFQKIFPRKFVSFKTHCTLHRNYENVILPYGAAVICFHGQPKPHQIKNPIISENWLPLDNVV
jgi:hypothetical protein